MLKSNVILSRVDAFLDWWLDGLLNLLPETSRERIRPTPDKVSVTFDEAHITLQHYDVRRQRMLEERRFRRGDELEKSSISKWQATLQEDLTAVFIELPDRQVLHKTLHLPLNAESSLTEILGFEMDRQTPFSPDQVYFDYVISKRDTANEKLHLDLYVVTKNYADPLIEELRSWDIQLHGIHVQGKSDINLLPSALRPPQKKPLNQLSGLMLFGCVALFFIMLYAPLLQQQNILNEFEAALNQVRLQARQTQELVNEKDSILARTRFLQSKREHNTPTIDIVNELSRILPDNTWLNRLIIRSNEIQLHGESNAASAIIQIIEDSAIFGQARFRSPVTRNNQTQRDKFHVSAQILEEKSVDATN